MTDILTPDQLADLAGITQICEELGADLVVIGATSLLLLLCDLGRFTRDVDLTVALDFDEFDRLTNRLTALGWTPASRLEHRWIAPRRTIVDLLPAGAELRRRGSITWPESQFEMSLAGFDHVFARAVAVGLPGGLIIRVAPPIVTALLKIIAYVEDPYRRAKDLQDIRIVLRRYEEKSDRLFSDVVFDADLPDFEFANAFLFGLDLRALATGEDARSIGQFLERLLTLDEEGRFDDETDFGMKSIRGQIYAFRKGFMMMNSYLLVTSAGSIQRVDSNGPITESDIRNNIGDEFETAEWDAPNLVLTLCFNPHGAQLGLPTNVKFRAKCGNVLIGVLGEGILRGLTDEQCNKLIEFISHAL